MRTVAFFGQRLNGTFVGEIAAPGADIALNGRRLFTTDAALTQIIFTAEIAFNYRVDTSTTNGPFGPVTTYTVFGAATYVFPTPLTFAPEINFTVFINRNNSPEYICDAATGNKNIVYRSFNDRVQISYSETFFDPTSLSAFAARVNVLNIPWDYG